ncbi:MAG: tetratricopeptide repeat protein, partial [Candidatus Thermoplasmatota archaeon]|nr:tetratricopeptide repeat protein [Candidatus Thermoplasmatota archaeon]
MMLTALEKPTGTLRILAYVYQNDRGTISDFYRKIGINQESAYSSLRNLLQLGLIYEKEEGKFPFRKFYLLTTKGDQIAKKLSSIEETLNDTVYGYYRKLEELETAPEAPENLAARLEMMLKIQDVCFATGEWDSCMEYCGRSLDLARRLDDKPAQLKVFRDTGWIHERRSDWDEARKNFESALEMAKETGDMSAKASIFYDLGAIHERNGEYRRALEFFDKSRQASHDAKNDWNLARALYAFGRVEAQRGNYKKSIGYMEKSIGMLEEIGDLSELAKVCTGMGATWFYLDDMDKTIEYHEKCIRTAEKLGDATGIGYGLSNAAEAYALKGD